MAIEFWNSLYAVLSYSLVNTPQQVFYMQILNAYMRENCKLLHKGDTLGQVRSWRETWTVMSMFHYCGGVVRDSSAMRRARSPLSPETLRVRSQQIPLYIVRFYGWSQTSSLHVFRRLRRVIQESLFDNERARLTSPTPSPDDGRMGPICPAMRGQTQNSTCCTLFGKYLNSRRISKQKWFGLE